MNLLYPDTYRSLVTDSSNKKSRTTIEDRIAILNSAERDKLAILYRLTIQHGQMDVDITYKQKLVNIFCICT